MKEAVLSLSGGMDSTGLLMRLLAAQELGEYDQVHAVSFNYGQKHKIELERAKSNLKYLEEKGYEVSHHIIDLSILGTMFSSALLTGGDAIPEGHYEQENMKATVVPNRNAIFSSIIYGYALSIATRTGHDVDICLGIHSGDHEIYPDCRQEFRDALDYAFAIGNWDSEKVKSYTPYLDGDKTSILRDTLISCAALEVDFDTILANTNTSYNPDSEGRSSGTSGADIERIEAFINIGRKDPVEYVSGWEEAKQHAISVLIRKK